MGAEFLLSVIVKTSLNFELEAFGPGRVSIHVSHRRTIPDGDTYVYIWPAAVR